MAEINPNSDRDNIDSINISDVHKYPKFLTGIKFEPFRHIQKLDINFSHPITVITGSNRIGKSTILISIACSHFNFNKRNPSNGRLERFTWGSIMRFTQYDKQEVDWTYWLKYRIGNKEQTKRGQRKAHTNKWNGVAKKESQIKNRQVVLIDLDRIMPMRNSTLRLFQLARTSALTEISQRNKNKVFKYLSYILEENIEVKKIVQLADKDVFQYKNSKEYSSYNSASGEDVLTRILIDAVEADKNALILIDEIEIGLHPKIQRRLVDIIYHISKEDNKQFIITSHSPTVIGAFNRKCRVFLERQISGSIKPIHSISVNAAFTKMDSKSYPLLNLYCEDDLSEKIIKKAIADIQIEKEIQNFNELINIIISGSADKTYTNFQVDKRTFEHKKIKTGYACILDGDMRLKTTKDGTRLYPDESNLFFLLGDIAPEKFLLETYLLNNACPELEYHLENTNPHALLEKIVEFSLVSDKTQAFEMCWAEMMNIEERKRSYDELKEFLVESCKSFSPTI